jgi:hypothetical protein
MTTSEAYLSVIENNGLNSHTKNFFPISREA